MLVLRRYMGLNSVVGIATRYELGGPGIEFHLEQNLRARPDRSPRPLYNA